MTITAKYASRCPSCGGAITPGQAVEWSRGQKARHTHCGGSHAVAAKGSTTSRRASAKVRRQYGRNGRYCCDECGDYVEPGTTCWEAGMRH